MVAQEHDAVCVWVRRGAGAGQCGEEASFVCCVSRKKRTAPLPYPAPGTGAGGAAAGGAAVLGAEARLCGRRWQWGRLSAWGEGCVLGREVLVPVCALT